MSNKMRNPYLWQEVRKKGVEQSTGAQKDTVGADPQFQYKDPVSKFQEVVEIPKACAGLVFGKKRENLNKLEFLFSVTIRVEEERDEAVPLVISSALQSDLDFVVRELETIRQVMPISQAMIGFACGKGNSMLKQVQQETDCRQIRIQGNDKIEFIGSTAAVHTAVMLMKVHLSYFDQFKALRDEAESLDKQTDESGLRRRQRRTNFSSGDKPKRTEKPKGKENNQAAPPENKQRAERQASNKSNKSHRAPMPNRWEVPIMQLVTF